MSKAYTLVEVAEIMAGEHKKGFANYLLHTKLIWNDLLRNTLYAFSSVWVYTNKGNPWPYVTKPRGMEMFLGLFQEVDGKLVAVEPASEQHVVSTKPSEKTCGCKADCNCGECCSAAHTVQYQTKPHIINGDTFYEKIWTETCANGDVMQYREVPTKKFSDNGYTVVYHKDQKRLCQVTVKPCGCVEDTDENKAALETYCGCTGFFPHAILVPAKCAKELPKLQHEGDRIYLVGGKARSEYMIQGFFSDACDFSMVPEFALRCVMAGADWSEASINPRKNMNPNVLLAKKLMYGQEKFELLASLNRIDMDKLQKLQDKQPKW